MMTETDTIRWGRIILGGLFMELAMFAVVIPLNGINRQATYYSVPFLTSVFGFLFGYWVARPLRNRFILHGVLTAVAASMMYVALTFAMGAAASVPLLYHFSHGLRMIGGAFGGRVAERRAHKPLAAGVA